MRRFNVGLIQKKFIDHKAAGLVEYKMQFAMIATNVDAYRAHVFGWVHVVVNHRLVHGL